MRTLSAAVEHDAGPGVEDHMSPMAESYTNCPQRLRAPLVPQLESRPPALHAQDGAARGRFRRRDVELPLVDGLALCIPRHSRPSVDHRLKASVEARVDGGDSMGAPLAPQLCGDLFRLVAQPVELGGRVRGRGEQFQAAARLTAPVPRNLGPHHQSNRQLSSALRADDPIGARAEHVGKTALARASDLTELLQAFLGIGHGTHELLLDRGYARGLARIGRPGSQHGMLGMAEARLKSEVQLRAQALRQGCGFAVHQALVFALADQRRRGRSPRTECDLLHTRRFHADLSEPLPSSVCPSSLHPPGELLEWVNFRMPSCPTTGGPATRAGSEALPSVEDALPPVAQLSTLPRQGPLLEARVEEDAFFEPPFGLATE
mmetsp:Transcript_6674/g.24959  ORF Transcript_6674/g.24959 Transcript_6674/m.24959 type:complete len:376 (-) Transcript_6674:874-2001(-)